MSRSREEIASKIREGTQRRVEELMRVRQLQQERREELKEREAEADPSDPSGYIPFILISLVFLSFPLSEPVVDWVLVGCFVVLNGLWTFFLRSSSWINWAMLIFTNFTVVRISPLIPELPNIISKLPPKAVATYVCVNIAVCIIVYYGYVERRFPWTKSEVTRGKKSKQNNGRSRGKDESLEEFVQRRDRMSRLDIAASCVLLGNLFAMVAMGFVPLDVLLQSFRQIVSFLG
ncbi:uncharacterized protein TM35_000541110 [Trypanosoma theileri]|uniref:Uncharacterized protein n=1 Tax=Trypanosoma theileri TaxID=67003 RepID=A0A1X0NGU0_9TRYP|nr:uncharacterized protein TM35_000541110 [Trypanosoma theileri]ORC83887.1 hypothetical protein TM35_000541110 [Trypanosoma theileri]